MWYNNLLAVLLCLILAGLGHPFAGAFIAFLLWEVSNDSTKEETDNDTEDEDD